MNRLPSSTSQVSSRRLVSSMSDSRLNAGLSLAVVSLIVAACATAQPQRDPGFRFQEPTARQFDRECGNRSSEEIEAIRSGADQGFVLPPVGSDLCEVIIYLGLPLRIVTTHGSPWPVHLTYGYFEDSPTVFPRVTLRVYMVVGEGSVTAITDGDRLAVDRIEWVDGTQRF